MHGVGYHGTPRSRAYCIQLRNAVKLLLPFKCRISEYGIYLHACTRSRNVCMQLIIADVVGRVYDPTL